MANRYKLDIFPEMYTNPLMRVRGNQGGQSQGLFSELLQPAPRSFLDSTVANLFGPSKQQQQTEGLLNLYKSSTPYNRAKMVHDLALKKGTPEQIRTSENRFRQQQKNVASGSLNQMEVKVRDLLDQLQEAKVEEQNSTNVTTKKAAQEKIKDRKQAIENLIKGMKTVRENTGNIVTEPVIRSEKLYQNYLKEEQQKQKERQTETETKENFNLLKTQYSNLLTNLMEGDAFNKLNSQTEKDLVLGNFLDTQIDKVFSPEQLNSKNIKGALTTLNNVSKIIFDKALKNEKNKNTVLGTLKNFTKTDKEKMSTSISKLKEFLEDSYEPSTDFSFTDMNYWKKLVSSTPEDVKKEIDKTKNETLLLANKLSEKINNLGKEPSLNSLISLLESDLNPNKIGEDRVFLYNIVSQLVKLNKNENQVIEQIIRRAKGENLKEYEQTLNTKLNNTYATVGEILRAMDLIND